jgi:hypothetical protein
MADRAESGTSNAETPRRLVADARNEAEDDDDESDAVEDDEARAVDSCRRGVCGMEATVWLSAEPRADEDKANGEGSDIGGSSSDSAEGACKGDTVRAGRGVRSGDADMR